jgi:[protein-PII] uridylyltransferase
MADLSTFHLQRMERINARFFENGDGLAAVASRAATVDEIVSSRCRAIFPPENHSAVAAVAVGGYGRSQLFPYSDVDLLFLFNKASDAQAHKERISLLLTELWDSGLRVSQSVRTPAECVKLAPENAELHVSLLDTRFLAGDREFYDEFYGQLPRFYLREQKALLRQLVELAESRHARYGRTIYHLEPNVKEGPGGLRDYQLACWISQLAHTQSERLPGHEEALPDEAKESLFNAKRFLFAIRCYLHYFNGRDNNKLTFDLQESIWRQGSGTSFRKTDDTSDWMRDYFRTVRAVEHYSSRTIDVLASPRNSLFTFFRDRMARLSNNDFAVAQGRLFLRNSQALPADPNLAFRMFEFVARHDVPLAVETEKRIAQVLPAIREQAAGGAELWPTVLEILRLPCAYKALTAMRETGVLFAVFPEFELIDCLVVRDFYHRYTVDEHTFLTIKALKEIDKGGDTLTGRFSSLLPEIDKPELLYFALLFHDVGKGAEGAGHSESSARIAEQAMARIQVPQEDRGAVLFLIRNHLKMSDVISGRDLNDPETVEQFRELVGTSERLKALTLMTFADTRSVNPTAMTTWRKELLWQLYISTHSSIARDAEDRRIGVAPSETYLAKAATPAEREQMAGFLKGFPHRYLVTHTPEQVYAHYQLSLPLTEKRASVDVNRRGSLYEVIVLTLDRPFLFASLCAGLSSFGLNIEKAEAFANEQGLVLDTFVVSDPLRSLELNPNEIGRLNQTLRKVARAEVDAAELLHRRRSSFRPSRRPHVTPQIAYDNQTSSRATIFHVSAADRTGLLFDLASKFSQHECDIEVVLIETRGNKAIDAFYLVGPEGHKLDESLCERLLVELTAVCRGGD